MALDVCCSEREISTNTRPPEHLLEGFGMEWVVSDLGQEWDGILRIDGWGSLRSQSVQRHKRHSTGLFCIHSLEQTGSGLIGIDDDVPQTVRQ